MKGRYNGGRMTVYGTILPGSARLDRSAYLAERLTERARFRIKVLDWHRAHGQNISLTARHFGLGRSTLHRWLKRFHQAGLLGLCDQSRRPKSFRPTTTDWTVTARVVELRKQYPAWSKYKLAAVLKREDVSVSASTIGRILRRKGLIEARVSRRRRRSARHPKARFPRGLRINHEGQLIQLDVKHIMLIEGRRFYQFTAIDVLSKRRVLRIYPSESSRNGALFLRECRAAFPFPIEAVQTDNGAPFQKEFARLCRELRLPHYFIQPRRPQQNSYVEISHGADEREFYRQGNICSSLAVMQKKIMEWEEIWNYFRPHQALGQLTPAEYSARLKIKGLPTRDVIVLQT